MPLKMLILCFNALQNSVQKLMVWLLLMLEPGRDPANIYLFKINNRNTRKTGTSLEFKGVYVSKMFTSKLGKLANFRS